MGSRVASDSIVQSIIYDYQRFKDQAKPTDTDEFSTSGGIIRSIASIRRKLEDIVGIIESTKWSSSNATDLATKLFIQQSAFDNACKLLLLTLADSRQDVDNMFGDPDHLIWIDVAADQSLRKKMGRFPGLCLASLDQLRKAVFEVYTGFRSLIRSEKKTTARKFFFRRWHQTKYSTIEDVPKLINNLRTYNDLFRTLVRQAVSSRAGFAARLPSTDDLWTPQLMGDWQSSSRHFNCTQRTSQLLFDAFSNAWICRRYKSHNLSISLGLNYSDTGQKVPDRSFCFSVTVTTPHLDGQYPILVHSTSWGLCDCTPLEKKHFSNLMKADNELSSFFGGNPDKAVNLAGHKGDNASMCEKSMRNSSRDLGEETDLCRYLKRSCDASESIRTAELSHLGYLQSANGLRFSLYYIPGTRKIRQTSYSLNDVLARAYSECRVISVEDRLRTASFLATGLLHLHSSSWLPHIWSSQDIIFFTADEVDPKRALTEPFLQVQFNRNSTQYFSPTQSEYDSSWSCLLSLGIVLIELAFCKPWHHLQLQDEITKDLFEWERTFLKLSLFSETVSRELGSKYARVVQTCLQKWFEAQGLEDPSKVEFDKCIFEDVVRELDEMLEVL